MFEEAVLVTGTSGVLGWHLCRHLLAEGFQGIWGSWYRNEPGIPGLGLVPLNLGDLQAIERLSTGTPFRAVVHTAAVTSPDACELDRKLAYRVNVEATRVLVESLPEESTLIYISTDLVYSGEEGPYSEDSEASPVNYYGETKLEAESWVRRRPGSVVLRLAKLYSNGSPFHPCFVTWIRSCLDRGEPVRLFVDQFRTPILINDACRAIAEVLVRGRGAGLYNLGGPERLSRFAFGVLLADVFGYSGELLLPARMEEVGLVKRGADCSLNSERFLSHYSFSSTDIRSGLQRLRQDRLV